MLGEHLEKQLVNGCESRSHGIYICIGFRLVNMDWTSSKAQDLVPKGTMKLVVLGQEVLGHPFKPWAKCKVNDRLRLEMVGNFCRFLLPSQVMMGTVSKWRFPKSRVYPYSYHFFHRILMDSPFIIHLSGIFHKKQSILMGFSIYHLPISNHPFWGTP